MLSEPNRSGTFGIPQHQRTKDSLHANVAAVFGQGMK